MVRKTMRAGHIIIIMTAPITMNKPCCKSIALLLVGMNIRYGIFEALPYSFTPSFKEWSDNRVS
jgi:hypothetical protein